MGMSLSVWYKKFAHCQESVDEQRPSHAASNKPPASFISSGHIDSWDSCLNECGRCVIVYRCKVCGKRIMANIVL